MLSGPICAMVWEGRDAVKTGRGTFLPPTPGATGLPRCISRTLTHPTSRSPSRRHQPSGLGTRHHSRYVTHPYNLDIYLLLTSRPIQVISLLTSVCNILIVLIVRGSNFQDRRQKAWLNPPTCNISLTEIQITDRWCLRPECLPRL